MMIIFLFCFFGEQNFGNGSEQPYRQTNLEMPPNMKTAVLEASPSREKSMEDSFPTFLRYIWILIFKNVPALVPMENKGD